MINDDLKEDQLLKSATQWQHKPRQRCFRAGNEAAAFLRCHQRQWTRNAALVDAWEALIPPGLKPWCRIDSCAANVLTVRAAPGPYMHQLQMMRHELIEALNRQCPSAAIRKIRIIPLQDRDKDTQ